MMLVLNRKTGESITVTTANGERIEFKVTKVKGGRVAIAIDAPETTKILRSELKQKPDVEDQAA